MYVILAVKGSFRHKQDQQALPPLALGITLGSEAKHGIPCVTESWAVHLQVLQVLEAPGKTITFSPAVEVWVSDVLLILAPGLVLEFPDVCLTSLMASAGLGILDEQGGQ